MSTAASTGRSAAVGAVEEEIRVLLHRVRRVVGTRAQEVHGELQGSSYILLAWLVEHGPLRATDIVEALGTDKGSLSRQLHHLEELELVRRSPDPEDGRATLVSLTPQARERLAAVDGKHRRRVCQQLAGWTVSDLEELRDRLAAYNRALGVLAETPLSDPARPPTVVAHGKGGGPRNEFPLDA